MAHCFSGCAKGLPKLLPKGCLRGLRHEAACEAPVDEGEAVASIPALSCPGLISRSQSLLSEEVASQRPTLLTKAAVPASPVKCDRVEEADGSLSALTTATAFEEALWSSFWKASEPFEGILEHLRGVGGYSRRQPGATLRLLHSARGVRLVLGCLDGGG